MVKKGGHNMLEPAFAGNSILFGPYTDDFKDIADALERSGAAIRVHDLDDLVFEISSLLLNPGKAKKIGYKAKNFSNIHKGAVEKTVKFVRRYL